MATDHNKSSLGQCVDITVQEELPDSYTQTHNSEYNACKGGRQRGVLCHKDKVLSVHVKVKVGVEGICVVCVACATHTHTHTQKWRG